MDFPLQPGQHNMAVRTIGRWSYRRIRTLPRKLALAILELDNPKIYILARRSEYRDMLIATQDLASEIQSARTDQYVMGVFTGDFPEQLLWMGCTLEFRRSPELQQYLPWSWASTLGGCLTASKLTLTRSQGQRSWL